MKKTLLLSAFIALSVFLLIIACQNPAAGDSSPSGPSVAGVDTAVLAEEVTTDDLGSGSGGSSPSDKYEALDAVMAGLSLIGMNFDEFMAANPDWEPSGELITYPANLFELEVPPESFSVDGSLTNESIDFSIIDGLSGGIDASGTLSLNSVLSMNDQTGFLEGMTIASSLSDFTMNTTGECSNANIDPAVDITVPQAKLTAAMNTNIDSDMSYYSDGYLKKIEAAYATSAVAQLAISISSSNVNDVTGNFIATLSFADNETFSIDENDLQDPDALSDNLPDTFELTIEEYDGGGSLTDTYYFSKTELIAVVSAISSPELE